MTEREDGLQKIRTQLFATSREIGGMQVSAEGGLTSGDTLHSEEAVDSSRRLAFHEQLQLYRLNTPLIESGLAFIFTPEDLRRADPLETDVFWETEEVIKFPGDEHAMALIKSTRGIGQDGTLQLGKFDSIFMTEKAYKDKGGKYVVLVREDDSLPKGKIQGRIQLEKAQLKELNAQLSSLNRITLPESLASRKTVKGIDRVVGHGIYPDRNPGNEWFYKRGHIALVLELDSGKSVVMTLNALGDDGRQGGVNLPLFTDGKFGIVDTVRMYVGAGRKFRPEISRGYADVAVAKYTEAIKRRFGLDMTADQLSVELGLNPQDALKFEFHNLRQDWAYENVTPVYSRILFNQEAVMSTAPDHVQQLLEEFEGLQPKKATAKEILELVDSGDMVEGFSLAVFASEFLKGGEVVLNQRYKDAYLVLERKSMPQLGGEETLVVPQGKAFDAGPITVGAVHPNTGNARFWYQTRYSTNPEVLTEGPKYKKMHIRQVLQRIANFDFSAVDSASIFKALYSQRVLVPAE